MEVRAALDSDSAGVIALIGSVFAEYPGCVLDVETEERGLLAPASSFDRFWVAESKGRIVGCIGCSLQDEAVELKKLYVHRDARRCGLARRLVDLVEEVARDRRAQRIELWSDTRFVTAHAAYARFGFIRTGRTRDLHDLSNTTEYNYVKPLA